MSLSFHYRLLIFYPQGDMEEYAGVFLPDATSLPVGTWAYDRAGIFQGSPWIQVIECTMPRRLQWEDYSPDAPDLIHVTKYMKMIALVMP